MLCNVCQGRRVVAEDGGCRPCPECGGFGEVHCCDGLQAQPEAAPASHANRERLLQCQQSPLPS